MRRAVIYLRRTARRLGAVAGLAALVALAATATATAATTATATAAPALPSSDSFYTYSATTPLAGIAPGTVLKTRAIQVAVSGNATAFSAEQVLYRTTGEQGQPTVTVTTIIRPLLSVLGTKLVAYQTAYDGLGSECDPSYTLAGGNPGYSTAQDEATVIEGYLTAGFTVEVSDYEGTNLEWAAGQESGYGTLDGIRAAENALGAPGSTPVAMVGYSGGSIATEWASELAAGYAPDLNLIGAAEGGIPVDFAHNLAYVNGSPSWSGVIPAVLVALSRAFGLGLATYLSPYGKTVTSHVAGECINSFLGAYPGLTVQQLMKPQYQDILAIPAFAKTLNQLIMGTTPGHPAGPLLMSVGNQDGTGDGVMVAADDEALAHQYCQEGVPVTYAQHSGLDHGTAALPFEASALLFVEARFAGLPAPNGCGLIGAGNPLTPLPVSASVACPAPTGALSGSTLGRVHLGMTRAQARNAYTGSTDRRGRNQDSFCLTPTGVRLGYASPKLAKGRRTRAGTVVWISTSNPYYALNGVTPGATLAAAKRRLKLRRPVRMGSSSWYLVRHGSSTGVLGFRHGAVTEIGIADKRLTRSAKTARALIRAFG
ncbi:MAG: hypothetical protein QOJ25_3318 [Solirubrobacteraceae bacterium]|nr:hypothetical protein [Solirubrobacteraceae bacterium]